MKDESHQHQGQSPDHDYEHGPVQYFLPNQIVLHIEHSAGFTKAELTKAMTAFLEGRPEQKEWNLLEFLRELWRKLVQWCIQLFSRESKILQKKDQGELPQEQKWKNQIVPPKEESILTFRQKEKKDLAFSILPVQLRNDKGQEGLISLLSTINAERNKDSLRIATNIMLKSAAPNWLMSGAFHGCGTGGPGSWPVQAKTPTKDGWKFQLEVDNQVKVINPGAGVHVAILDTMPCLHEFIEAYEKWHQTHALIKTLLDPMGPLHMHPATYADLLKVREYSVLGHRYRMPDHGLFIAGIIHTIAPKTTLHLYEVLNPYGVGCIEMIAQGLLRVIEDPEIKRPLIINCSFMLGSPLNIDPKSAPDFPDFPKELKFEYLTMTVEKIFDWLTEQEDVVVVAAAGNDRQGQGSNRPAARYPAASDGVLGVGALSSGDSIETASYSNLSDKPPKVGYVTFGGEPGEEKGVLGVYIGDFPTPKKGSGWDEKKDRGHLPDDKRAVTPESIEYERNTTGWAWWAGTSFATPIISGVLAARWSQNANPGAVLNFNAGQGLLNEIRQRNSTAQRENVIFVKQG